MTRINEAMRRAAEAAGQPPQTTDPATDSSLEFIEVEGGVGGPALPDEESQAPSSEPGPLVVQAARPALVPVRAARNAPSDDVEVTDLLSLLYRRRWAILAIVAAAVGGAVLFNASVTPIYVAKTRLIIEPNTPQVVTFRPIETEELWRTEYYQTQMQIISSRDVARRTLERLGVLSENENEQRSQIGELVGALTVDSVTESRLVEVSLESPDPEYAARVVNAHADAYLERNIDIRVEGSRDASKWLSERLGELREEVSASEGALQQYREQTEDAISLEDRQNIIVQKLAQLNAAATQARTRRIEQEALYSQLQAIEASGTPVDTFPAIVGNTFIQGLKAELANLQRERAQLAQALGDRHPDMVRLDSALASSEQRLSTEVAKVVDGIRNDYRAAQANEQGLVAALEEQKQEVLSLNRDAIGYGALQRDATSTQEIFESLLQRVKEADLTGELLANNIRILDRAEVPRRPIWPRSGLNLILALLGGSMLAVGFVLGQQYLRPRLVTPDDVVDALGLPLLGIMPAIAELKRGLGIASGPSLPPEFREAFRVLRAQIMLSPGSVGVRTLAVTSARPGEGKTMVACNLAIAMALSGRRVLLVDGDMRRSQIHTIFDLPLSPGLADVITRKTKAGDVIRESGVEGLWVLPAGVHSGSASDLLESVRNQGLIRSFGRSFDFVVIDTPPVMAVADASILANAAAGALFVVGANMTSRDVAQEAVQRLESAHVQLIGVALNKAEPHGRTQNYSSYYQREEDDYDEQAGPRAHASTGSMRG